MFVPIVAVLIPTVVVIKQPDLGSAVILMAPLIPLLYWVGVKPLHIFLLLKLDWDIFAKSREERCLRKGNNLRCKKIYFHLLDLQKYLNRIAGYN